jgi:hypothetical protein
MEMELVKELVRVIVDINGAGQGARDASLWISTKRTTQLNAANI